MSRLETQLNVEGKSMTHKTEMKIRMGILLFGGFSLMVSFQNCAKNPSTAIVHDPASTELVASTKDYSQIDYAPNQFLGDPNPAIVPVLHMDLATGLMKLNDPGQAQKSCQIDPERLMQIDEILAQGKICKPKPLPPGQVSCDAISPDDVRLMSEGASSINLQQLLCNYGVYLCDGQDEIFRNILSDLVAHPPAACN